MFMKETETGTLIKVLEPEALFDPIQKSVRACKQAGQAEQFSAPYDKALLKFPSGESLPRCWIDPDYQLM